MSLGIHLCVPRWILSKHEGVDMCPNIFICVVLSQPLELSGVQIFFPHKQRGESEKRLLKFYIYSFKKLFYIGLIWSTCSIY